MTKFQNNQSDWSLHFSFWWSKETLLEIYTTCTVQYIMLRKKAIKVVPRYTFIAFSQLSPMVFYRS
uniref:Uncharacterized protein n=1 Tax=Arundo donax TaxID=35708 RepID=A0A0A9ELH3_ARUDO